MDVLRQCSIPEWILNGNDDWRAFFEYLKSNITDANILTDEELIVRSSHNAVDEQGILDRKKGVDEIYPNIWQYTDDTVANLERELMVECQNADLLDNLLADLRQASTQTTDDSTDLQDEEYNFKLGKKSICIELMEATEELHQLKLQNEQNCFDLNGIYAKPTRQMLFMHQMPLDDFFQELETFIYTSEENMKRYIDVQTKPAESGYNTATQPNTTSFSEGLVRIGKCLVEAHEHLFSSKMKVHAKMHLIRQYKDQNWTPTTLTAMQHDVSAMEREAKINDTEKERLSFHLKMQCTDLVRLHIEEQISQFGNDRIERGRQRLDHITQIASVVSDVILITEIIWILLQFDMERAKTRNDFAPILELYRNEAAASDFRMEAMSKLQAHDEKLLRYLAQQQLELLTECHVSCLSNEVDFIQVQKNIHSFYRKQNVSIDRLPSFTIEQLNNDYFRNIKMSNANLQHFLKDGPMDKPQWYANAFHRSKVMIEMEVESLSNEAKACKERFARYEKLMNDKFGKYKHMLWIWYLTDPLKVVKAIKLMSVEAHKTAKSTQLTTRPLCGITRKDS